jgi:hypothetical protein
MSFKDLSGKQYRLDPQVVYTNVVTAESALAGYSNGRVLRAGTMLFFVESSDRLDMSVETREVLLNARERLDEEGFNDEIQILNNYLNTLKGELEMGDEQIKDQMAQTELFPAYRVPSLDQQLQLLFQEVILDLQRVGTGNLAVSDLVDTENAIRIGHIVAADLILTGTMIEMTRSVIIFSRIIDVETGEIESSAQVIIPKSVDVTRLLSA